MAGQALGKPHLAEQTASHSEPLWYTPLAPWHTWHPNLYPWHPHRWLPPLQSLTLTVLAIRAHPDLWGGLGAGRR